MADKFDHASVNYRDGEPDRRCSRCTMFQSPASCTAVKPPIRANGLCDIYKRRRARALVDDAP